MTGKRPVDAIPTFLGSELARAACRGKSPLFDATVHGETVIERDGRHGEALAICARCPVTKWCLEYRQGQEGVWGGQLFGVARRCACGTPLPEDAPPYRKHCDQACADSRRDRRRTKAETRTVTCACGTVFTTTLHHQRFCTTSCRRAHEYVRSPNPAWTALSHCQNCGDPLPKGARRRNCSTACRKKAGTTRATATRRELAREQQEAA